MVQRGVRSLLAFGLLCAATTGCDSGEQNRGDSAAETGAPAFASSSRLALRPLGSVAGAPLGYVEYLPPDYGTAPAPLIVHHHGIASSGDGSAAELLRLRDSALITLVANDQWPRHRPFVVLAPQHLGAPQSGCHSTAEIEAFLAFAIRHYAVDPQRVYYTGVSCGAIAGWHYLAKNGNARVAASVLVSGDGREAFERAGCALADNPVWALANDGDAVVPPAGSRTPIEGLNAQCDPVDARLSIYPTDGHDAWTMTFDLSAGNDVFSWLLGHARR